VHGQRLFSSTSTVNSRLGGFVDFYPLQPSFPSTAWNPALFEASKRRMFVAGQFKLLKINNKNSSTGMAWPLPPPDTSAITAPI
jgi:hypothetical protein